MRPRNSDFFNSVEAVRSATRQPVPFATSPSLPRVTRHRASSWREAWQASLSRIRCWMWQRGSCTNCSG